MSEQNKKGTAVAAPQNQEQYIKSKQISKECRKESFEKTDPTKRTEMILKVMGNSKLTAREICYRLHNADLNYVRPRITELVQEGRLKVVGKAYDARTSRKVSVYQKAGEHDV